MEQKSFGLIIEPLKAEDYVAGDGNLSGEVKRRKICQHCSQSFTVKPNNFGWNPSKYCSRTCHYASGRKYKKFTNCTSCNVRVTRDCRTGYCSPCRNRLHPYWLGKKRPSNSGSNNNKWKGGITPINTALRHTPEYKKWRTHVFQRDNYTCQSCGQIGGKLQVDHLFPFSLFPSLRLEILNGQTLCIPCHKRTPTYLMKSTAKLEQFI